MSALVDAKSQECELLRNQLAVKEMEVDYLNWSIKSSSKPKNGRMNIFYDVSLQVV